MVASMIELRILVAVDDAPRVLELVCEDRSVGNVAHFPGAAHRPHGDVIICDVAGEDASELITELRNLGIQHQGSIVVKSIDAEVSDAAEQAERATPGHASDAVVWEGLEARTSQAAELTPDYMLLMVLATLIAMAGIFLNTSILLVGAMIVGPDFGPIAGVSVALGQRQWRQAGRSLIALLIGFPTAIAITYLATLALRAVGVVPVHFTRVDHSVASAIAHPGFFSLFVALLAGIVGMRSLSTAKSGALIGVLVSVTTIPAAASIAVAIAYDHGTTARESITELAINIGGLLVASTLTLLLQKARYLRRRTAHHRPSPSS